MYKDTLLEILKSDSMPFTVAEIEEIMDNELSKDVSEMDTELVEMCVEILYSDMKKKSTETEVSRKKGIFSFRRVLLVAAIILIFVSIVIPVSAKHSYGNFASRIVEFYSDYFKIDLKKGSSEVEHYSNENTDLLQELKDKGVDNVILPSALLEDKYLKEINIEENDDFKIISISLKNTSSKTSGEITIDEYKENFDFSVGKGKIPKRVKQFKQISVNGLDVLIFANKKSSYIIYSDSNKEYNISLKNYKFEDAVKIAETLQ